MNNNTEGLQWHSLRRDPVKYRVIKKGERYIAQSREEYWRTINFCDTPEDALKSIDAAITAAITAADTAPVVVYESAADGRTWRGSEARI